MAKGRPCITDNIKEAVAKIHERHPNWSIRQVEQKLPIMYPGLKAGRSSIDKIIHHTIEPNRQKMEQTGIDEPWHMGTLNNINISSEAIPYIHLVQRWIENNPEDPSTQETNEPVTIRQALWISRIYALWDLSKIKQNKLPGVAASLYTWSKAYVQREIICQLLGIGFDTFKLDDALRNGAHPVIMNKSIVFFYKDHSFDIDSGDLDLLKQIEELNKENEA